MAKKRERSVWHEESSFYGISRNAGTAWAKSECLPGAVSAFCCSPARTRERPTHKRGHPTALVGYTSAIQDLCV